MLGFRFSYIIPLCNIGGPDFSYRLKNLSMLLSNLPPDIELIFVEQIVNDEFPVHNIVLPPKLTVKHIRVKYPTFNKLWLYNLGVRNAATPNILLAEGDILVDVDYFKKLEQFIFLNNIETWCFGWGRLEYLNIKGRVTKTKTPERNQSEGGLVYFNRPFFYYIGMGNEWIQELGGDDNELAARAEYRSNSYIIPPFTIKHQHHPRGRMNGAGHIKNPNIAPHYQYNLRILQKARKDPELVITRLRQHIDDLGRPNGPACKGNPKIF